MMYQMDKPVISKWKTARELKLSKYEYEALIKVRGKLLSGEYRHAGKMRKPEHAHKPIFDMHKWREDRDDRGHRIDLCQTAGCIGGWMEFAMCQAGVRNFGNNQCRFIGGKTWASYSVSSGHPLYALFYNYPGHGCDDLRRSKVTPGQAVEAIDRVLTGNHKGNPWRPDEEPSDRHENIFAISVPTAYRR